MAQLPPPPRLDLHDLKAVAVLGHGAKGVVFLVRTAGETLALKAVSRSSIERKAAGGKGRDAYRRVWIERDVLHTLHHPLLPSLRGVVYTDRIIGFAIDRCSGGDLTSLRRRQTENTFSDDVIRFYAAELVLALEYLHGLGIVYRDLKPENVLVQDNGHLMLVDFDLSTKLPSRPPPETPKPPPSITASSCRRHGDSRPPGTGKYKKQKTTTNNKKKKAPRLPGCFTCNAGVSPETAETPTSSSSGSSAGKSNSFVGTEEYVAPEIIQGTGHDFAVDWWGLGVVLYEMLYGRTPFRGENRKETFYRILTKEPELSGEPTPLRGLIRRLLEKDARRRIACDGVKAHEFFRWVEWDEVLRVSRPPFIPPAEVQRGWEEDGGFEGLDVERTVEEASAAKQGEKVADRNRSEGVTNPAPISADFSVF